MKILNTEMTDGHSWVVGTTPLQFLCTYHLISFGRKIYQLVIEIRKTFGFDSAAI